jgi:SAM-dependent methyltransferase
MSRVIGGALADRLRCPRDGAQLALAECGYRCSSCATAYPVSGKVVDFRDQAHDFYEGKYTNEVVYNPHGRLRELPLWIVRSGYIWAVRRHVARGSTVVELGCAAGVRWFGSNYRMIGLDFSKEALAQATADYELGLAADALAIPLADASVDAVVSASFFEHIAPGDKGRLVAELKRVLRPGGTIVFEHDVETNNPLIATFRAQDPARYDRLFLEGDAHIGYERHAANDRYFTDAGFDLVWSNTVERLPLQPNDVYAKLATGGGIAGQLARIGDWLSRGIRSKPWLALVRLGDVTIGRLAPTDWGRIAITVARKPL